MKMRCPLWDSWDAVQAVQGAGSLTQLREASNRLVLAAQVQALINTADGQPLFAHRHLMALLHAALRLAALLPGLLQGHQQNSQVSVPDGLQNVVKGGRSSVAGRCQRHHVTV